MPAVTLSFPDLTPTDWHFGALLGRFQVAEDLLRRAGTLGIRPSWGAAADPWIRRRVGAFSSCPSRGRRIATCLAARDIALEARGHAHIGDLASIWRPGWEERVVGFGQAPWSAMPERLFSRWNTTRSALGAQSGIPSRMLRVASRGLFPSRPTVPMWPPSSSTERDERERPPAVRAPGRLRNGGVPPKRGAQVGVDAQSTIRAR
jgi:hypothetical protein